jgi:hypothetical protein
VDWIERYWYAVFGVVATAAYVSWQMRGKHLDEPLYKRLLYTIAPVLDKDSPERQKVTPMSIVLVAVGLLLVLLANLAVKYFD